MKQSLKGKILDVDESEDSEIYNIEILTGEEKGDKITVELSIEPGLTPVNWNFEEGQTVFLQRTEVDEEVFYSIDGHVRTSPMIFLAMIFVAVSLVVGRIRGLGSLVGLVLSIGVLFGVTIPLLIAGYSTFWVGAITILVVLIPTMYLSHGFNPKTTTALIGTLISLVLAILIGQLFIYLTKLTGLASEEASTLALEGGSTLNFGGILLLSLIIGAIGVIDDVTVSQVSSVLEIFRANSDLDIADLYERAMVIGRDHIASMVNTLVMAYVGAALPMVMLFYTYNLSAERIVNIEFISEEIVRTLVGSIALVVAVPITTFIASYLITRPGKAEKWLQ